MDTSSATATARQAVVRGLRLLERSAGAARRRIDRQEPTGPDGPPGEPAPPPRSSGAAVGGRYGKLWLPGAETDAMALILNTSDPEAFEAAGKADAARLSAYHDDQATVLDLGCGIGRVATYVAPACRTLWAVDASPRMLELARHRLAPYPTVRFARCVDTAMPDVPSGSVDLAYSLLVLQHLEREDAFLLLEELRRVVAPGGVVVVTFPNLLSDAYLASFLDYVRGGEVTNPARARMYTPEEVGRILPAAGFDVELEVDVEILAVCRPRSDGAPSGA